MALQITSTSAKAFPPVACIRVADHVDRFVPENGNINIINVFNSEQRGRCSISSVPSVIIRLVGSLLINVDEMPPWSETPSPLSKPRPDQDPDQSWFLEH